MSGLIDRQTAIDYVDDVPYIQDNPNIGLLWKAWIEQLPSAQPELFEQSAYVRGFEQGRTQGMIDAQERKKMNKQRKVLITITYNEMGIIIDTKAEEVAQPNLQPTCNQLETDVISRQAAIEALEDAGMTNYQATGDFYGIINALTVIKNMPSAQPSAQSERLNVHESQKDADCISRQAAIDALWKALHEYADKTEKQFQESDDLDVGDWIVHRIFVENMSDIDRKTILQLPSAQPERKTGLWIETEGLDEEIRCTMCTNPMRSDRGCDGSCQYDEKLYKRIMSIIKDRIDGGGA